MQKPNNPLGHKKALATIDMFRAGKVAAGNPIIRFMAGIDAYDVLLGKLAFAGVVSPAFETEKVERDGKVISKPTFTLRLMGIELERSILAPANNIYAWFEDGTVKLICVLKEEEEDVEINWVD
jgi:hypothetical protein